MVGNARCLLPMILQEPNSLDGIEASVIHPVMRRAKAREIVRRVVPAIIVEVRYLQTRSDL